jgi:hypothetical protein
LHFSAFVAV